jgi:hypothetical protein
MENSYQKHIHGGGGGGYVRNTLVGNKHENIVVFYEFLYKCPHCHSGNIGKKARVSQILKKIIGGFPKTSVLGTSSNCSYIPVPYTL